jgi:glycogenin glucosyltransferase
VYDYNSLVDRWFAVYDKHYRSAPPTPSPLNFEVARYDAVWDEGTSIGAEVVPSADLPAAVGSNWASSLGSARLQSRPGVGGYPLQVQASGPLSLDDLRRMAVEGAGGIFLGANAVKQEGEYRPLPLDGRIDLMRPKRESPPPHLEEELESGERTPQQESFPPGDSHHTSGHAETAAGRSAHRRRHQRAREHQPNHDSSDSGMEGNWLDQPPFPGHKRSRSSPPRPLSPPKITWDPAVDPPPNVPPPASAFPSETYFANAWDRPQGRASDVTYQAFTLSGGESREPFFHIPPPSAIPEALLQQGAYDNVVHGERVPQPDPSKVKAVFPWEEQPRHAPTRAFPKSESPPRDTIYLGDELPAASATAKRPVMHKSLSSSLHNPSGISFTNAWDTVPSIKKYANKLARAENAPVPRVPSFDDAEYQRSRDLHDRLDALSREADDEDDGDEEESDEERDSRARSRSTEAGRPAYADHEEGTQASEYMRPALKSRPTSRPRIRSGSGSPITTPFIVKKEYQSQAVQTFFIAPKTHDVQVSTGVQVTPPLAHAVSALAAPSRHGHGRTQSASITRPPSDVRRTSFSNRLPTHRQGSSEDVRGRTESLPVRRDRTPLSLSRAAPASASSLAAPLLLRSHPRKTSSGQGSPLSHSSPSSSSAETPARRHQLGTVTTGVGLGLGTPPGSMEFPGRIEREVSGGSAETGMTSPLRTPSTPFGEFDPIGLVAGQKPSRNWNPNTGVDVFKRGSEEVLARFLRQGSWEADSPSRPHSPHQQRP